MERETIERIADLMGVFNEAISGILEEATNDTERKILYDQDGEIEPQLRCEGKVPDYREIPVRNFEESTPEAYFNESERNISPYEINIHQVNNGIIVYIGCQTFVFEDVEKFSKMMVEYYKNPKNSIDSFYRGDLFK
jgi:hypothetical protein